MTRELQHELEQAIRSTMPLDEIVALLRRYQSCGVSRDDVYAFLGSMRANACDEETNDRILEVADFVAGFCSPHMTIWDR
jgi:hypothetical protein